MYKLKDRVKVSYLLLLFGIGLFVVLIFIVNLLHFTYRLNADLASDVVLAKLIWDSKEIIPRTWYTANELRIICTPNISALFYGIIKNASLATGLGCCFMTIGIIMSINYFMDTIDIKGTSKLLMIFLCLMLPCSFNSLELLYLFASYYAVHVIALFLTLGFYNSYIRKGSINWLMYILLAVISLLLGMQGVRGILVIFGPLFCIEVMRNAAIFFRNHTLDKQNKKLIFLVALLLVISYAGTFFPLSVGQNVSRNMRKGFLKLVFTVIPDVGKTIGFEATNLWGRIILAILCLLSVIVLFRRLQRLFRGEDLEAFEWSYLVLSVSPVLTIFMVAFTTIESTERYYFILLFMIAMSVVLVMRKADKKVVYCLTGAIVLLTVINVYRIYVPILTCKEPPQSNALTVAEYLKEKEYSIAYTSFENANTITVLSNNEIIVAPIADFTQMDICKWMSSTEWYVPNRPYIEKTAYILPEAKKDSFLIFLKENKYEDYVTVECNIGEYWIFSSEYNLSNFSKSRNPSLP